MEGTPSPAPLSKPMIPIPRRHKWAIAIAVAIPLATIAIAFALGPAPEKALHAFYEDNATLTDGGAALVPVVVREISNKAMPRRRHAIQFLGEHHHRIALPALEAILNDETEQADFRARALEAISAIDKTRGRELASMHAMRSDHLGESAKALSN